MARAEPLAEVVRSVYLGRSTGVLRRAGGTVLYFVDGELFLPPEHPMAELLRRRLESGVEPSRAASDGEIARLTREIARELAADFGAARFDGGLAGLALGLVGPMATVLLTLELAVLGLGDAELRERLGAEARYRTAAETPALRQLPSLDPDMGRLLVHLESPTTIAELKRLSGMSEAEVVRSLARLRAIGLAECNRPSREATQESVRGVVTPRLLGLFRDRIGENLDVRPLDLAVDAHRAWLGDLVARQGSLNHYELLDLDPTAAADSIHDAYQAIARRVHPRHAEHLGFGGRERVIDLLFELVTEAYVTLSDPKRRSSYNLIAGVRVEVVVDFQKRTEEKRKLARRNYKLALHYISQAVREYSIAIDLLDEAVRLDPRPEYFALLGQAKARNPEWYLEAIESYRQAIALAPEDPALRIAFGGLLEGVGEDSEAETHYRKALELEPGHGEAELGMERVARRRREAQADRGGRFQRLFGRRRGD